VPTIADAERAADELDRMHADHARRIAALESLLPAAVLDLIYNDQHSWSTRPCPTCNTITSLIGQPYGCVRYARQQRAKG